MGWPAIYSIVSVLWLRVGGLTLADVYITNHLKHSRYLDLGQISPVLCQRLDVCVYLSPMKQSICDLHRIMMLFYNEWLKI